MVSENDNLPTGGTDNAQPSTSSDTSESWDYFDPDEDQDNGETSTETETDGETDEAAASDQEAEVSDDDDETETAEAPDKDAKPAKVDDTVIVELQSGEKVPLSELKNGYLRQADYSRKTQETSNYRRAVEAEASQLQAITATFTEYLAQNIPEAPSPSLAYSDPGRFTAMKATHDAAVAQIEQLVRMGAEAAKTAKTVENTGLREEVLKQENEALAAAFPETRDRAGREKFFNNIYQAAQELGVSSQELSAVTDHRFFAALHFAAIGKRALAARSKAQEKVKDVPPVAAPKRTKAAPTSNNRDAMAKLARSGSIRDAMRIDFD